jgi:hypothetical protein
LQRPDSWDLTLTAHLVGLQDRQFSLAQKSFKALIEGYQVAADRSTPLQQGASGSFDGGGFGLARKNSSYKYSKAFPRRENAERSHNGGN